MGLGSRLDLGLEGLVHIPATNVRSQVGVLLHFIVYIFEELRYLRLKSLDLIQTINFVGLHVLS